MRSTDDQPQGDPSEDRGTQPARFSRTRASEGGRTNTRVRVLDAPVVVEIDHFFEGVPPLAEAERGRPGLGLSRTGNEVDFIVYGPEGFWAVEVKNSKQVRPQDLRGLRAFYEDYPECTPLLVFRGDDRAMRGNVLCVPAAEFLSELRPGREIGARG